ncbi:hypothetical protein PENDEC_c036G04292 [Penicillium decumbens]|uniref:CENP-S associating centromere protein X domain-containing protein n=1 Tax=Penicillium decumbens TaxID=69771 RepID=A0A1V6NUJ3_PENDC|nr:hypothetical protein PENDEC_c036G04292 [Penicillium decumbens]
MAGEPQPAKKRRLPFKPPSRTPSNAGPSSSSSAPKVAPKAKGKARQNTAKASSSASASKSANPKSTSSTKRSRAESPPASVSASDGASDLDSGASSRSHERSLSQEPDYILAEITTNNQTEDVASSDPKIPPKLLTRLLHHNFHNERTKVAKDANDVVAKYVDVFVREAIARAAYERAETDGAGGARSIGDGFLEVEDLEKMAPQLTMDF